MSSSGGCSRGRGRLVVQVEVVMLLITNHLLVRLIN